MLKPLTSLRFIFALMVFLAHLGGLFFKYNEDFLNHSFAKYIRMEEGHLGVSFFFILSGFILAYNYRDKFINKAITYRDFMLARIFRIYPLHILTLVIAIIIKNSHFDTLVYWGKLIVNLLLLQSFVPVKDYFFSFNNLSWSISDEMFFYTLFPILILLVLKLKKYTMLLIVVPPIIIAFFPDFKETRWVYYINPFFRVFDFLIGISLFELYRKTKDQKISFKMGTLIEIASVIVFILFYAFYKDVEKSYRWSIYYWIPMSLIVYVFSFQKGFLSKILSNKKLIWLGEISFCFYMIHQLVINVFWALNYKLHIIENGYVLILAAFFVSLIGSGLIFKYYEKPVNSYLRKRYIKK